MTEHKNELLKLYEELLLLLKEKKEKFQIESNILSELERYKSLIIRFDSLAE